MQTVLTTSHIEAAKFIKRGCVVAFPTETVYGLGANIFDDAAIKKIFEAKGRPNDNPLIAHIAHKAQIQQLATVITPMAEKFIAAFFPGALTVVLPKRSEVSAHATAGLETIGIRMPQHKLAHDFLQACDVPLAAPSANLSGKPSPTTWQAVYEDLNGKIDCILKGEQTDAGLESTVVDCTGDVPLILRAGAVTLEQLQSVIPQTQLANRKQDEPARSPGLKYKHYSPRARVVLTDDFNEIVSPEDSAYIGLDKPDVEFGLQQVCGSVEEYAHSLFLFFRLADERGIKTIYCQRVQEKNLGLALMDRLKRAAK